MDRPEDRGDELERLMTAVAKTRAEMASEEGWDGIRICLVPWMGVAGQLSPGGENKAALILTVLGASAEEAEAIKQFLLDDFQLIVAAAVGEARVRKQAAADGSAAGTDGLR